jgi:hypothetical protein
MAVFVSVVQFIVGCPILLSGRICGAEFIRPTEASYNTAGWTNSALQITEGYLLQNMIKPRS